VKKLAILVGFLLGLNMSVLADKDDGIAALGDSATDAQKELVRKGAQDRCDEAGEDKKEECVMDYYAQHNLEEEPSCD
jgi:hypothetical protein